MSAINRTLRAALPAATRFTAPRLSTSVRSSIPAFKRTAVKTTAFSTMSNMQSAAGPVETVNPREYDPEIKDIASFVHNTPIDSDLAVSCPEAIIREGRCAEKVGGEVN